MLACVQCGHMARTAIIHVRVTPEVRELIRMAALSDQRSLSDWCAIQLAMRAVKPQSKKAAR